MLDRITIPTLILHALDDPFVRLIPPTRAVIDANPNITFIETANGGHCAFLAEPDPANDNDGYWAEHTTLRFILEHLKNRVELRNLKKILYPLRKPDKF